MTRLLMHVSEKEERKSKVPFWSKTCEELTAAAIMQQVMQE